ncbi:Alpha/beta hydrolase fold-1 [Dillenia turbinata]|uniref:Alpha/beta hydrolase fold-1 n=1 Tax=Dillenia turbinata TaxID=194707 RepID=A0AAN8Z0I1_9MAGN
MGMFGVENCHFLQQWRYTYPLLEDAGLETWAVDILGWGFSDLDLFSLSSLCVERLPPCDVKSKRGGMVENVFFVMLNYFHGMVKMLFEPSHFDLSHFSFLISFGNPTLRSQRYLVGPSLGAAVAIDFAVNYSEVIDKLVMIDASVYSEGTGNSVNLPRTVAYAGVYILKSIPVRLYANFLAFNHMTLDTWWDWTKIGRLHCLFPWWEDATVDFIISRGYNVTLQIEQVKQKTLIIWGENDQIISNKLGVRPHGELPNAIICQIPDCGHLPHVEKPSKVRGLKL